MSCPQVTWLGVCALPKPSAHPEGIAEEPRIQDVPGGQ